MLSYDEMVNVMSEALAPMRIEIGAMHKEIREIRSELSGVKTELTDFKSEVYNEFRKLNNRVADIERTQKTEIVPQLKEIRECYLTTFERYQEEVDNMKRLNNDIPVLTKVVNEHTKKIEELSGKVS